MEGVCVPGRVLLTYKKTNNLQQLLVSKLCRCWWDEQCRLLYRLPYVYALSKFKEGAFNLQKAWHSSTTLLTQVHRVVICNIIVTYILHPLSLITKNLSWLPPFSYLRTLYLDKESNRHIKSINISLWYNEEYYFDFVM
jgi:hypothetical protein